MHDDDDDDDDDDDNNNNNNNTAVTTKEGGCRSEGNWRSLSTYCDIAQATGRSGCKVRCDPG